MRKLYFLLLAIVCQSSFCQYKFTLEGKVQDPKKKKIYLQIRDSYSLNEYVTLDSSFIEKGSYKFSGNLNKKSEIAYLFYSKDENNKAVPDRFRFVLENGANLITINLPKANAKSQFSNAKRPSSVSNELYNKLDNLYEEYFEKYATYVKSWDVKNPKDVTMVKMLNDPEKEVTLREKQLEIVKSYPNSFYSLIFIYESLHQRPYYKAPLALQEIFDGLDNTIKNDPLGIEFTNSSKAIAAAEAKLSVEKQAPIFTIKTDKGETFTNSSLLGKPYILAFSATWCAPCKQMEPKIKSFYDKYKDKGLEVVYFNFDDNDKKWKEHIAKNNLSWINVSEGVKPINSVIQREFNITGIPLYVVVDKKGTIIYNSDTPVDYEYVMLEKNIIKATE